jgi:hypothetical protein
MTGLAHARELATAALFGQPIAPPARPADDIVRDCCGRLAATYPVVRRMIGAESFRSIALHHAISDRSPESDAFPRFLRTFGTAATIRYLADIAELEMLRDRAARCDDGGSFDVAGMSAEIGHRSATARLILHASVGLIRSQFPIVTIWEANQRDDDTCNAITRWGAEAALVTRLGSSVEMRRLTASEYVFLATLRDGCTIAAATAAACAVAPRFNEPAGLRLLVKTRIVTSIRWSRG